MSVELRRKSRLHYVAVTLCFALLVSSVAGILSGMFVFAAPALSLKWTATGATTGAATNIGAQAADLRPDIPGLEIVVTGSDYSQGSAGHYGYVTCLNGQTGAVIWKASLYESQHNWNHAPFEIADLEKDGNMEIVLSAWRRTIALNGEDGSVYWDVAAPSYDCLPAICDVNMDGYPEVFVSSGYAIDEGGVDYITALSYDGRFLAQAPSWHPCWGGLSIGDANFDGLMELYQGDRGYSADNWGAWGPRCLDPLTLATIWNRDDIYCSSSAPMLADVNKDGILDVIVGTQSGTTFGANGIAVLRASDGTTIRQQGNLGITAHSQPTICDIDYDGNLEFISNQGGNPKIWDLYAWEIDATLPIVCGDPPKIGDINGDGRLEIIAIDDYYIRSYQVFSDGSVVQVDVVGELTTPNSFTLLADVDADGLNELVVTSMIGTVYCYDTPTVVANPRQSWETPFYSGRRLGVAEYVPPPGPFAPVVSEESPANGAGDVSCSLSQLSFRLFDFQGDPMSYTVTTAPNIGSGSGANVYNGLFAVPVSGLGYSMSYSWTVSVTDGSHPVTKTFSFTTMDPPPMQDWWNMDWMYRKAITVDHANVVSDLAGFPLLVSLTDLDLARNAQADGDDFVFTDSSGRTLPYELESYDSATGRLVAWVQVSLSSSVDTSLYLYYGNPSAVSQENAEEVWYSDFLMVQHLSETSGVHYDSTVHNNDGVVSGSVSQGVAGVIGGCDDFNGGYVELPRVCISEMQFTFSAWIYARAGARYIISEWNDQGAFLQVSADYAQVQFFINDVNTVYKSVTLNQWHYVVGTFDGTTARLWLDGGSASSASVGAPVWPSQDMFIGDRSAHDRKFNGFIDEVRVSNVAESADWVNTEYNNQRNPSAFYTVGSEQFLPPGPVVTKPNPANLATGVSLSLTELSFNLTDYQGDLMDYTVTTSPNIGGRTQLHVVNGTYSVSVSGLNYGTTYTWSVVATDGTHTTTRTCTFTTEPKPPPEFLGAGTGSTGTGTSRTPAYPSGLQAGDLILLQVTVRDTTYTPSMPTSTGFKRLYGPDSTGTGRQWIYYKFATGSESGTITVNINGYSCKMARMYAFGNVAPESFAEAGGFTSGVVSKISAPSVTTSGDGYLAVSFVFVNDDNAVDSFTGETGGDWQEAVAELTTTSGSHGCIQLQTATMYYAGTISEGYYVMSASDRWGVRAFAIKPAICTLKVNVIGGGFVSVNPAGASYTYGSLVELTATANLGHEFVGWTGDLTSNENPVIINMTSDKTITATFSGEDQYSLIVDVVGGGSVTKYPDQLTYVSGTVVELSATADFGWSFSAWSGDLSSSVNPETIVMDGDKTVTATFTQNEYTLTVTPVGSGSVIKTPDQITYHYCDVVELTAVPPAGWSFSAWSGDASGSANPTTVTMDGNKAVTATFTPQQSPVINYVAVWSYSDHNWVSEGGSVLQRQTIRIYAGISSPVEPVSISYGPTGSLTTVTALYESTWDYYYFDWVIPSDATLGSYDVQVESGVTSFVATGRFEVGASAPVVNYVGVWSYSDHNWISQGGTVVQGHMVRIYAGISNAVEPVSISYGPSGGSLTTVTALYESTWNYYYFDWMIPSDATLGAYDVKVESGVTSFVATGRFQVGASAPVVNYIAVWSYSDHDWISEGGTVLQEQTIRIYAGISNRVEPVSISYGPSGGSLTTVTALYESTWNYYYFDWTIPADATLGSYDVKVESGVTSFIASGRFQVARA